MHIKGYKNGEEIMEIRVNPFSYSYSGDLKRIERMLSQWEEVDGPLLDAGGRVEKDDGTEYHTSTPVNDEEEKLDFVLRTLQVAKTRYYFKIIDG